MSRPSTITSKGQATIPEDVRLKLQVIPGDFLYFEEVYPEKKSAMVRVIPKASVGRLFGSLQSSIKSVSLREARDKGVKLLAKKYHLKK